MNNPYDILNGNPCCGTHSHCNCSSQIEHIKHCLCCINRQLSTLIESEGAGLSEITSMISGIQTSINELSGSITSVSEHVENISTEQSVCYNSTMDSINSLSDQSEKQYKEIMEAIKKCCKCKDNEDDDKDKDKQ